MLRTRTRRPLTQAAESAPANAGLALTPAARQQSILADQFFYFFLRLRKGECRRVVQRVKALYPNETPEQHARRLILAQCSLSLVGGAVLYLPTLFPVATTFWKAFGLVGGASMLARLNLYLILEIALLYGKDIDDQARVPELMAVVAASGMSAASPVLVSAMQWHPAAAIPASGLTASAVTKLVGESAIAFYKEREAAMDLSADLVPAVAV